MRESWGNKSKAWETGRGRQSICQDILDSLRLLDAEEGVLASQEYFVIGDNRGMRYREGAAAADQENDGLGPAHSGTVLFT